MLATCFMDLSLVHNYTCTGGFPCPICASCGTPLVTITVEPLNSGPAIGYAMGNWSNGVWECVGNVMEYGSVYAIGCENVYAMGYGSVYAMVMGVCMQWGMRMCMQWGMGVCMQWGMGVCMQWGMRMWGMGVCMQWGMGMGGMGVCMQWGMGMGYGSVYAMQ